MTNEIATAEVSEIAPTESAQSKYGLRASYDLATEAGQVKAFNAGVACDEKIADHVGEQIQMVDWLIEGITGVDELTGEVNDRPHIVITDANGVTYEGQSVGLYQALARLSVIRPVVDQDNSVLIEFVSRKARRGTMLTFKML